jgi:hypothetical protein
MAQATCHLARLLAVPLFILLPPDHAYCKQHPSALRWLCGWHTHNLSNAQLMGAEEAEAQPSQLKQAGIQRVMSTFDPAML